MPDLQSQNHDGTQEETRIYEDVLVNPDGSFFLFSDRPPEDVFNFGLPIGPRESFMQVQEVRLTAPSERSITQDREDGLCIYCQLLLLPDAPEYTTHQPCMGLLIRNWDRCVLCRLINVSIGRANPAWKAQYEAGLADLSSPDTRIWAQNKKFDKYSLIVATLGGHSSKEVRGTPIVWTTSNKLGTLSRRLIWEAYYSSEQHEASARLNVIKDWLRECQSKHTTCNQLASQGSRPLPTRVLRITPQNATIPFTIQLHEPDGESAPYIALSHCWGKSGPLRTIKSNIEQHKQAIVFEALPLSYRDVVVKAWYLGFQYLWIDSLCIIQDDNDDWEAEAARMAAVYSNATLTFAATEAADPSEGCCPRYSRAFPIPLEGDDKALVRFQDNLNLNGGDAALNTRGWAFQEAALSRRMVCFDNDQLLWKCTSRHESEDGLRVVSEATPNTGDWNVWACLAQLGSGKPSYVFWYKMMEDYSGRKFTFEKDKLPALAGIVEVFEDHVDDAPLVGLWHGDILDGLLWRAHEPGERVSFSGVVPSWSWTSVSGRVSWGGSLISILPEGQLKVISVGVDWAGRPMTSPISGAALEVHGRLKKAKVVRSANLVYLHEIDESSSESSELRTSENGQEETLSRPEILGYCHLDVVNPVGPHIWCLEVYQGLQRPGPECPRNLAHRVLLLEPVNEVKSEFSRVGDDGVMGSAVKETFLGVPRRTVTIL
ncbi:HET domain protein [Chaetomium fimeti]|uniref:HET domain protein n=1 Tax=Chaetomium fimeti TaxID=1854472 RepID=A0AAE0H7P4_9PEZI|nr:HET domain protein [Chaetomium fimeti]KAK3295098.1 HET domain protein [Chaetomium fimeti]